MFECSLGYLSFIDGDISSFPYSLEQQFFIIPSSQQQQLEPNFPSIHVYAVF